MNYAAFKVAERYYNLQPQELERTYFLYNIDENFPGMTMYKEIETTDPETASALEQELEDGLQAILAEREQEKIKAKFLTFLHVI